MSLNYLLIEGKEFDIGVRVKKLDEHFLTNNYPTDQQLSIRRDGCFPWMEKPNIPVFLGYRLSDGLQRTLTHIVVTREILNRRTRHREVDWMTVLWTLQEGVLPIRDRQDDFLAPPPKFRRRRPKQDETARKPGDRSEIG
jgi:hypothetical protein